MGNSVNETCFWVPRRLLVRQVPNAVTGGAGMVLQASRQLAEIPHRVSCNFLLFRQQSGTSKRVPQIKDTGNLGSGKGTQWVHWHGRTQIRHSGLLPRLLQHMMIWRCPEQVQFPSWLHKVLSGSFSVASKEGARPSGFLQAYLSDQTVNSLSN